MDVAAANSRNLEPIFLNILLDFKYGFDEAKPTEDERIEAYEYRSECFTYDETEGNWTRHQPARNRTYIVEATEAGVEKGKSKAEARSSTGPTTSSQRQSVH